MAVTVPEWPITIYIGCDYSLQITMVVSKTDDTPVPITGFTYAAKIKDMAGVVLVAFTCTVTNGPLGILTLTLTDTQTAALSATSACDRAVWDLIETAGTVTTPLFEASEVTIKATVSV